MARANDVSVEDRTEATARSWVQVVDASDCPRCGGLMVAEQCPDLLDGSSGYPDFVARRCVQCGEIIDPVILQNRRRQPASGHSANRAKGGNYETAASNNREDH